MVQSGSIWVDGVKIVGDIVVKNKNNDFDDAKLYAVTENGLKILDPFMLYVDNQPISLGEDDTVWVSSATECIIGGKAYPVGSIVHLSKISKLVTTLDEIRKNEYAQVVSDNNGDWQINSPENYTGCIAAWIEKQIKNYNDLFGDHSITIYANQTIPAEPSAGGILKYRRAAPSSGNGYAIEYSYTCPSDVVCIKLYGVQKDTCSTCDGSGESFGYDICGQCGGSGVDTCQSCGGSGLFYEGEMPCHICGGTGEITEGETCFNCGGMGSISSYQTCDSCGGSGISSCPSCNGSGVGFEMTIIPCPDCSGTGGTETLIPITTSAISGGSGSVSVWINDIYDELLWECKTASSNGKLNIDITYCKTVSNGTCLSGDTLITLADYSQKRLDELTIEDIVLDKDKNPTKILFIARGKWNNKHILYYFDDGTVIDETHEHRFYNINQGFWQKLKNWNIGDKALRLDGKETTLISKEIKNEKAEMFGVWTEGGTYWANQLLSGDATANLPVLSNATISQAMNMAMSLSEYALVKILGED